MGLAVVLVIARAKRTKQSSSSHFHCSGLLRGARHRARIRATRWLAMTVLAIRRVIRLSQNLRSRVKKPSAQSQVERATFVVIRRGRPEWRLRYGRSEA